MHQRSIIERLEHVERSLDTIMSHMPAITEFLTEYNRQVLELGVLLTQTPPADTPISTPPPTATTNTIAPSSPHHPQPPRSAPLIQPTPQPPPTSVSLESHPRNASANVVRDLECGWVEIIEISDNTTSHQPLPISPRKTPTQSDTSCNQPRPQATPLQPISQISTAPRSRSPSPFYTPSTPPSATHINSPNPQPDQPRPYRIPARRHLPFAQSHTNKQPPAATLHRHSPPSPHADRRSRQDFRYHPWQTYHPLPKGRPASMSAAVRQVEREFAHHARISPTTRHPSHPLNPDTRSSAPSLADKAVWTPGVIDEDPALGGHDTDQDARDRALERTRKRRARKQRARARQAQERAQHEQAQAQTKMKI